MRLGYNYWSPMILRVRLSLSACALALSLATLLATTGCGHNTASDESIKPATVNVRFPIPIIEAGQASFYVAQDKGYYSAEHLDVHFQMGSRELNPVKTVATGQDTFGVLGGPDTLLVARSKGQPLKAIAVLHRNSNFSCLLTLQSSGLTKLGQLKGKKIGFNYGHISTDVLRNLLRRQKIPYTEVDAGFDYNQLIAHRIDAEWAFTVTAGLDLPAKGVAVNIISPADYGIVTDGYTIFATDQTVAAQSDLVSRFLRATLRGVRYAVEHPEEANDALLKRDPSLDKALSLKRVLAYNAVTSNSEQFPPGYMDRPMFQRAYDRLAEEKIIDKPFDPGDAYTPQFLAQANTR